ncbi:MAG: pilus assembly protein [Chloroflexi bacterium]|nr:MAG: pilus assembly protein [Chloroflexota bacterium]
MKASAGRAGRGDSRAGERGQAVVELALSTVFLMILLGGLLDLSRAFHYTVGLEGAVRAGARHGAFFQSTIGQQPYLDNADIKQAVDQVLAGDGLNASTLVSSASCLTPTDSNTWVNPPYASSAYPSTANTPTLYICYDTQGANKSGNKASPPAPNDATYTGSDVVVILLDKYGLIGGLSSEYLKSGSSLAGINLTAFQHFSVQG